MVLPGYLGTQAQRSFISGVDLEGVPKGATFQRADQLKGTCTLAALSGVFRVNSKWGGVGINRQIHFKERTKGQEWLTPGRLVYQDTRQSIVNV